MSEDSEFGKGLTYCLGLFLCHAERDYNLKYAPKNESINIINSPELWFNGASDHLYDLVIPAFLPVEIQRRLEIFQSRCLHWGHGHTPPVATKDDMSWAIGEAQSLLLEIDMYLDIEVKEAGFK